MVNMCIYRNYKNSDTLWKKKRKSVIIKFSKQTYKCITFSTDGEIYPERNIFKKGSGLGAT